MRAIFHYLGMMIIIPIYGIQVCPFIEGQNPVAVFLLIDSLLLLAFLLRTFVLAPAVGRLPMVRQALGVFVLELGTLIAVGLILSTYNWLFHDFPLASGLKLLVGITGMGLFASTDLALERERIIARRVENEGLLLKISEDFFPLTSRLALFSGLFMVLLVAVFSLLVIKDLDWIVSVEYTVPLELARTSILKEFGFVFVVVLCEAMNIVYSFTSNLNMFLQRQNTVLQKVSSGNYDAEVPVSSSDEFGVMALHTNEMIKRIRERTQELDVTRDVTILTLASLAETRDNETGSHILRTQRYVRALAHHLRFHPRFADVLDEETIDLIYKSAPLHDIGKVGIADEILLKPGKLSDEEFDIMKTHAVIGADALQISEQHLGSNSFLNLASEIALTHHEKWDGSGYPAGMRGDEIPVSGRLMAVADVYDALISKRIYKPAFSHQKAMQIILQGRGSHFDPDIIDALVEIEQQFRDIARRFSDEGNELPVQPTVS